MYSGTVLVLILGMILICYACWIYGKWCPMYMSTKTRVIGLIVALITLAGGALMTIPATAEAAQPQPAQPAPATPAAAEEAVTEEEEAADDEVEAEEEYDEEEEEEEETEEETEE